ncbi:MAG: cache domain-containing protein, partial [Lachnospiraceae bacterium]|nr:cache domain-containing protein [Lachnospiraceae bacterium]
MAISGADSKKIHSRNSMVSGLRVIMLIIVLLLSVSFFVSVFYIVDKERRDNITRESDTTLNTISDSILSDIERYKEMSRLVMTDEGFIDYLTAPAYKLDAGFLYATRKGILGVLNATTMVDSVFAFRDDGMFVASNRDQYTIDINKINDPEWRRPIEDKMGGAVILVNADNTILRIKGRPFVSIGRMVYDVSTQKRIGMMFMNISSVFIDRKLDVMPDKNILVMGADGTVLSGDERLAGYFEGINVTERITHKVIKDGSNSFMFSVRQITELPIYIGISMPIENGFVMYGTLYVILFLLVVFLVAIVIAGTYITRNITNPVSLVTAGIEENKKKGILE